MNNMGVVEIYEDFFSGTQAKEVIKAAEALENSQIPLGYENASIGKGHKGGDVRSNLLMNLSGIASLPAESREVREAVKAGNDVLIRDIQQVCTMVQSKLEAAVNEYTKKYEFPILFDEGFQLLKYGGGQEYKPHADYAPHIPRYLSALILLNPSEYEGGGTYFIHFDEMIKPDKPALVLFPSNYAYVHQAMPVVQGTKYAIVTWLGHPMDWDGMPLQYREGVNNERS